MNLKAKPFNLTDKQVEWVNSTISQMTDEEKIGQLFCMIGMSSSEEMLKPYIDLNVGGVMFRNMPGSEVQSAHRYLQENSKIPMLLAANLEQGGVGIANEGTDFGKEMQVAATNDLQMAYKLGKICGIEGSAVGVNWSFAPIVDIDYNFRNPITNLRTFGSNPDTVLNMSLEYNKGIHEVDMAVSIKHFPGDGVDERDQHLVASVNTLSVEEWDKTYGNIYQTLIDDGAETVMIGHIKLPSYEKFLEPTIEDKDILPGSLSKNLLGKLLREKMGFNGLITTDATQMAGFMVSMSRKKSVPYSIEAGCDMFLFAKNVEEDFKFMLDGYKNGILSEKRLNEALSRILALKCKLNLLDKDKKEIVPPASKLSVLGCAEHKKWAFDCADKAITLVKDTQNMLPMSAKKGNRLLFVPLTMGASLFGGIPLDVEYIKELLEKKGFVVDIFTPQTAGDPMENFSLLMSPTANTLDKYDCALYVSNLMTASNNTVVRINWTPPMGIELPWFVCDLPTAFVSFANPYHLIDVPMVKTFVNAYGNSKTNIELTIEKLCGDSEFKGVSPVDPFCGQWDTRF